MAGKKKKIKGTVRRILTVSEDPASESNRMLRGGCSLIEDIDKGIQQVIADLRVTLNSLEAYGLSAPQIGCPGRIIAVRTGDSSMVLINPVILSYDNDHLITSSELCLSVPGVEQKVTRYSKLRISAYLPNGTYIPDLSFTNMQARCIQHEIDHLNGILITDHETT